MDTFDAIEDRLKGSQLWVDLLREHNTLMLRLLELAEPRRMARVRTVQLSGASFNGHVLTGKVAGNSGNWSPVITIKPKTAFRCDCPDAQGRAHEVGPCKHVLALGLLWQNRVAAEAERFSKALTENLRDAHLEGSPTALKIGAVVKTGSELDNLYKRAESLLGSLLHERGVFGGSGSGLEYPMWMAYAGKRWLHLGIKTGPNLGHLDRGSDVEPPSHDVLQAAKKLAGEFDLRFIRFDPVEKGWGDLVFEAR